MARAVVRFWGDALVRWPEDVVDRMSLSQPNAEYLRGVGLPVGVEWSFRVAAPHAGESPTMAAGFPAIADHDGVVPICVDPRTAHVVAIEDETHRFVNSDIPRFGTFLMLFRNYCLRVKDLDEEAAQRVIDQVENDMTQIDSAAMQPESYWPVVVEQMRDGLL
jgi:hypothetical protein